MVFSRAQARAALDHVFDDVLDADDDSPLKKSLLEIGIKDVFLLCTMDTPTIDALVYEKSDTEKDVPISKADKSMLKAFISYVNHLGLWQPVLTGQV